MNESNENTGSADNLSSDSHGFLYRFHGEWLEIFATVLLALATVFSAWSAYQATRWSGVEARRFNEANANRIYASEEADIADVDYDIDTELFVDYLAALRDGDSEAVRTFEDILFREEMRLAVGAWLKTDPFVNPQAPETPFSMSEYKNAHKEKSKAFENVARGKADDARMAIENSDRYVLLTVLFASVLFFAGICTKFKKPANAVAILVMGYVVFTVSIAILAFQPIH
ncbi:MAG: hypothetical protein JXA49_05610 [Actinobacteria bacterium]|nr:hypothetical protein [Actinomycetota bacterium]